MNKWETCLDNKSSMPTRWMNEWIQQTISSKNTPRTVISKFFVYLLVKWKRCIVVFYSVIMIERKIRRYAVVARFGNNKFVILQWLRWLFNIVLAKFHMGNENCKRHLEIPLFFCSVIDASSDYVPPTVYIRQIAPISGWSGCESQLIELNGQTFEEDGSANFDSHESQARSKGKQTMMGPTGMRAS